MGQGLQRRSQAGRFVVQVVDAAVLFRWARRRRRGHGWEERRAVSRPSLVTLVVALLVVTVAVAVVVPSYLRALQGERSHMVTWCSSWYAVVIALLVMVVVVSVLGMTA